VRRPISISSWQELIRVAAIKAAFVQPQLNVLHRIGWLPRDKVGYRPLAEQIRVLRTLTAPKSWMGGLRPGAVGSAIQLQPDPMRRGMQRTGISSRDGRRTDGAIRLGPAR
jgi:hypothetical protein